ncbi:MAG TPA: hypothetical protein VKT17_04170, partial [Acidobacteriota bacterium]|nr:hypothetical protein [Acidobacteriota bacterium]
RNPTYAEYRQQIFSAIVLGIDRVLFWYDKWATPAMKDLVDRMVGQIREIGPQMNNGITNDPRIEASVSDRDQLVYRYGVAGGRHVLLAVNIANRTKLSGATLSNVRFGLPSGVDSADITVLDENRTLAVVGREFTDTFVPFAVHIYIF